MEHKSGFGSKFSHKYNLTDLLYIEKYEDIREAIQREKQLKNWHRDWKLNLIKSYNPDMIDIAKDWFTDDEINVYKQKRREEEVQDKKEKLRIQIAITKNLGMPKRVRHDN